MPSRWEISPEFPRGRLVEMTPEEAAQHAADVAAGEVVSGRRDAEDANRRTIEQSLADRLPLIRDSHNDIIANPPLLWADRSAAERRSIRDLERQVIELTRLVRDLLEGTG